MEDKDKQSEHGFTITDRRRFDESGETRDAAPGAGAAPDATPPPPSGSERSADSESGEPPVNFASFVLGLSTQALMALGEVEDPVTRQRTADLPAARHLIDILGVLQEKTRNNLDQHEHALLESALYDLRVRFVALVRQGKGSKEER